MQNQEIEEAKRHILSIYKRYESTDKIVLKGFANTVRLNLQNFPSSGHFIIEFIQNADDANSSMFKLNASDNLIEISNDGKPFSKEDVESICNSASSGKNPEYNLGYLGVGFKSCFKISNSPQISSGAYSFKFDKETLTDLNLPYELMPIWVDSNAETNGTIFRLPLVNDQKIRQIIANQLESEVISGKLLLFLKNLNEINITSDIEGKKVKKIIKKVNVLEHHLDYEVYQTQEESGAKYVSNKWAVFKKTYDVPTTIKNDEATRQFKRDEVRNREVLIAFGLDDNGGIILEQGSIHFGVYSFLPLRDVSTTFKFIMQGDFLTNPGRSDINREAAWNLWTAECLYDLIVNSCIPAFIKNEKWKYQIGRIFYAETSANEIINKKIIEPLWNYIRTNPIVFDANGKLASMKEVIDIPAEVTELFGVDEIKNAYGIMPLDSNVEYASALGGIREGPDSIMAFMESKEAVGLFTGKAKLKNIKWFEDFYLKLIDALEDENELVRIQNAPFILTNIYDVLSPRDVRIVKDSSIPESKLSEFEIVNKDICANTKILAFLEERLKIKSLTMDDVRDLNQYTPEEWTALADTEKINFIRYLEEHPDKLTVQISYLTLPTKDGKWEKPEFLLLPEEYESEYKIEKLVSLGFIKERKPRFVSPLLIKAESNDKKTWRIFLREKLKCDDEELLKGLAEEVGIASAKLYEVSQGCVVEDPRPVGLNISPGYDLKSITQARDIKLIEVKSSRGYGSFDMNISPNEYAMLNSERNPNEKYFIYAVKDALDSPVINILDGEDAKTVAPRVFLNESGRYPRGWRNICKIRVNVLDIKTKSKS